MHTQMVFVNQTPGYLMVDIINAFHEKGIKCSIVSGSIRVRNTPLPDSVNQHRIISYSKKNVFTRLITWLIAYMQILWIIKTRYPKAEIFFVSNPPLVIFMSYLLRNKISFLLYDLYPEALVKHGWLHSDSWVAKFWISSNRKAFQRAKAVFTISQSMFDLLQTSYKLSNIHLVPLWADGDLFKVIPENLNPFVKLHKLDGKFLVVYSGNLGYTHDVDVLVDVASHISDERIFFLIIGNGEKEELIKRKINNKKLNNCLLLPFQPAELLPFTIGCAHLGVVTLSKVFDGLSIPSKTFTLLSAGKPILCISSHDSELSRLVVSNNIGESFDPSNLQGMASFITDLVNDTEKQELFRKNALYTATLFDKSNAKKFPETLIF
jgi:glycosyltransferase involved in cell wall biosynthesis